MKIMLKSAIVETLLKLLLLFQMSSLIQLTVTVCEDEVYSITQNSPVPNSACYNHGIEIDSSVILKCLKSPMS